MTVQVVLTRIGDGVIVTKDSLVINVVGSLFVCMKAIGLRDKRTMSIGPSRMLPVLA